VKGALRQPHLSLDLPTPPTGPRRGEPAVTKHQFAIQPGGLVTELATEVGPGGIPNGAGKAGVADESRDIEILDHQLGVGLGELARDLVQEAPALIGDAGVLTGQSTDCLDAITGSSFGARHGSRAPLQPTKPASQRLWRLKAANHDTLGGGGYGKHAKAAVDADPTAVPTAGTPRVASPWM
jgi:hypothetical protein